MTDLNEKLAQEAAELINGGEWRDCKWYSDGHRDAWCSALKPSADRIEKLEAEEEEWNRICNHYAARIDKLEKALKHCINALRQYEMGDDRPRGPIPNDNLRPWLLGAMDNAIKVLEGKDD